jgi:hypothetical protein
MEVLKIDSVHSGDGSGCRLVEKVSTLALHELVQIDIGHL